MYVQMGNPVFCIFIYLFFWINISSLLHNLFCNFLVRVIKSRRVKWGTYNDWEKGKLDAGVSFGKN